MQLEFEFLFGSWLGGVLLLSVLAAIFLFNLIRKKPHKYRSIGLFMITIVAALGIFFIGGYELFVRDPKVVSINGVERSNYSGRLEWINPSSAIEVIYDRPLDLRKAKIDFNTDSEGNWEYLSQIDFPIFTRKLKYTPTITASPDTRVQIYVSGFKSLFGLQEASDSNLDFFTKALTPPLTQYPLPNSENVPLDTEFSFNFASNQEMSGRYRIESTPYIAGDLSWAGSTLNYLPRGALMPGQNYTLKLVLDPVQTNITNKEVVSAYPGRIVQEYSFRTSLIPGLSALSPQTQLIDTNSEFTITFNEPLDTQLLQELISIEPSTPGVVNKIGERTVKFTPSSDLLEGRKYRLIVSKEIKFSSGVSLDEPVILDYLTYGNPGIIKHSPAIFEKSVGIAAKVLVEFDQPVVKGEAIMNIEPPTDGELTWQGNTLIFTPESPLRYATEYNIQLSYASKVGSMGKNYSWKFSTSKDKFELPVPQIYQTLQFECNITAARMLLAYRGQEVSYSEFYARIAKQDIKYDEQENIWGDPDLGYVGDITGENKGYGVHWGPIASVMSNYGEVEVYRNWNLQEMLTNVSLGRPAVVWWQNGRSTPKDISWQTPEGKQVQAVNGMHSEVVVGWVGMQQSPEAIILRDPWRGRREMKTEEFLRLWGYYANTAVSFTN